LRIIILTAEFKLKLIIYDVHLLFCKYPFKNSGDVFIYFQFKFLQRYEIVLKICSSSKTKLVIRPQKCL